MVMCLLIGVGLTVLAVLRVLLRVLLARVLRLVRGWGAAAGVALSVARVRAVTVSRTLLRLTIAAASAVPLLARPTSHRADLHNRVI